MDEGRWGGVSANQNDSRRLVHTVLPRLLFPIRLLQLETTREAYLDNSGSEGCEHSPPHLQQRLLNSASSGTNVDNLEIGVAGGLVHDDVAVDAGVRLRTNSHFV